MERNGKSDVVEMSCMEARMLSSRYLDGDLDLAAFVRVDAHLNHCLHCSAIYGGIRNVVALLGSDEVFPLPAGIEERFYNRLVEPSGRCAS